MLALTWVFAPAAVAGGPTSVLITSPESEEAAGLYYSDGDYESLKALLGVNDDRRDTSGGPDSQPSLDRAAGMRQLNVTWMVHDVQPWRLDQVYVGERPDQAIWIHTSMDTGTRQGTWHRAPAPRVLHELLAKLGVLGKAVHDIDESGLLPGSDQDQDATSADTDPKERTTAEEQQPVTASGGDTDARAKAGAATGWWWAIPGLAAGAVVGLALRPLAARLPRPPFGGRGKERESGPRRQLLDGWPLTADGDQGGPRTGRCSGPCA
ncbi:hypothetical protein [Streptomyces sp. NPDC002889]|uniref:hypothetical protein n=1 Tax=Streptomyces sp. NPDC002889 TaxID=3364669 RepID=UPI0036C051AC